MAIQLDKSRNSVVVYCTLCAWREVTTSTFPARRAGAAHEAAVHQESRTAYNSFWRATRRGGISFA